MGRRRERTTVRRLDTPEKAAVELGLPNADEEWQPTGRVTDETFGAIAAPASGRLVSFDWSMGVGSAFPVDDPARPELLAEFAGVIALERQGKQLVPSDRGRHRFFYFGTIMRSPNGPHEIGDLSIHAWPRDPGPGFRGVTREVLRSISPTSIVEQVAHRQVARRISERRIDVRDVLAETRDPEPLRMYARRYLELQESIGRGIHQRLADEFGISPARSREWTRRAKSRGLLVTRDPGQGRAGALPGPNLTQKEEGDHEP